jgi:hypothetical protein
MTSAYRRLGGISVPVATTVIALAACSSGASTPQVASLGGGNSASSGSGSSPAPQLTGNPTQLMDKWATCMRSHGYPSLADPTIDANKVIHIIIPPGITGNVTQVYENSSAYVPCNPYLVAASTALRGDHPVERPDTAKLEKFSQCMRTNGIQGFPDPSANGLQFTPSPGTDLDPENPTFQHAQKKCAIQVGIPQLAGGGTPQPGSVQIQQQPSNGGPGGGGGANG